MRYYCTDGRYQITYSKRVTRAVKMVDSCSRKNGVLCTVTRSWLLGTLRLPTTVGYDGWMCLRNWVEYRLRARKFNVCCPLRFRRQTEDGCNLPFDDVF